MRKIELEALENVAGGVTLHGLGFTQQAATSLTPTNPTGTFDPSQFGGMPMGMGMGPWGGGGHHGMGHEAFREFVHDPAFQGALQTFEQQHPELAQAFGNVAQSGHGLFQLMHDPNGRAAVDQFMHDPSFANAVQQFSAAHPDLAGPLGHMVERFEMRLEHPEMMGGGHHHHHGGDFGGGPEGQYFSGFGPGAPYGGSDPFGQGVPYGQGVPAGQGVAPIANGAQSSSPNGVGIDPAAIGLPTTF